MIFAYWCNAIKQQWNLLFLVAFQLCCCCSVAKSCQLFASPWAAACQASLSFTISLSLLKHWVGDAIQPSHPLSPPWPLNHSQHKGLFQWVSSLHQVAKVLEFQLQQQSFQWIFRVDFLSNRVVWFPCSPRDSWVFSSTTVQKHQFFSTQPSYGPTLKSVHDYWKNHSCDYGVFVCKVVFLLFRFVVALLPRSKQLVDKCISENVKTGGVFDVDAWVCMCVFIYTFFPLIYRILRGPDI